MRSWPIRRKLLVIPLVAVLLLMLTALYLWQSSRRFEHEVRAAVEQHLNALAATEHIGDRDDGRAARAATSDALNRAHEAFVSDRLIVAGILGTAFIALLVTAWLTANGLAKRIGTRCAKPSRSCSTAAPRLRSRTSSPATRSSSSPTASTRPSSAAASARPNCAAPPSSSSSRKPRAASASSISTSSPAKSPAPRCSSTCWPSAIATPSSRAKNGSPPFTPKISSPSCSA